MSLIQSFCAVPSLIWNRLPEYPNKIYVIDPKNSFFDRQQKYIEMYADQTITALAYVTSIVASATFLAGNFGFRLLSKVGIRINQPSFLDFHYLYESKIFESYLVQMQNFVQKSTQNMNENLDANLFEKEGQALIHLILNPHQLNNEEAKRQFHQKMLSDLRHLINKQQSMTPIEKQEAQGMCQFVNDLCEWMYTEPMIMNEMTSFIQQHLSNKENEQINQVSKSGLPLFINHLYQRLGANWKFKGIDESELRLYDPHFLGDIPSMLFSYPISNGHEINQVKVIRTPVVTRDLVRNEHGKIEKAQIVEEFIGFLNSYKEKNKTHVYINLMERSHSEGVRSKLIEDLEINYPNTIHVISLAKNSDFYRQRKAFKNLHNADEFKKSFMNEMFFGKDSNYHWSPALGAGWELECNQLLNDVHICHFNNQNTLDHKQRIDFIEIAYTEIIEKVFVKLQPDTANHCCKSCIDRGAGGLGLQYLKMNRSQELSASQRKELVAIVLAPAILAMNRVLQSERFSRFNSAAHLFLV